MCMCACTRERVRVYLCEFLCVCVFRQRFSFKYVLLNSTKILCQSSLSMVYSICRKGLAWRPMTIGGIDYLPLPSSVSAGICIFVSAFHQ